MNGAVPALVGIVLLAGASAPLLLAQDSHPRDWASLDRQAEDLYDKGDLKEAIRIARLAAGAASGPRQSGRSLDRLGFFEYTSGNLKEAESLLRRALELRKNTPGIDTADYAESANDLALLCRDSGKLPEARELAGEAVAIRSRVLGAAHPRAESLNTLGSTCALQGEYDLAISRFEAALAIHDSQSGPKDASEEYGTLCINLAGTYQRVGKYAKAELLFAKGLAVLRVKPGVNHPAYPASLVAFAYLQADLGHYSAAEKLYDESGRLLREQLGEQHPVYATFLNNRAALYTALGNLTVAESDYRKALELKRRIYGGGALTIGASLRNLARLVYGRNPSEGEKLFQQAVDLYRQNPKAPAFDYSSALLGLAEAQRNRGDLRAAREILRHASDVAANGLGMKHPLYAAVLRDLGLVHQAAREYPEAMRRLAQAVALVQETQGDNHPDLVRYLHRLAAVYEETGDYRAAEPLYRRSLDISGGVLADMLTVGSESNKLAVVANLEDPVPALLSFQRKAGDRLPAARALAFEAVASRKGRVLDQVHDWGQSLSENPDSGIRTRFNQRQAMLGCEASLTIALGYRDLKRSMVGTCALPGTVIEGRYERLLHDLRNNWTEALGRQALHAVGDLKQRIDTLEAGLSRDNPRFTSVLRPTRLGDIRSRLQADELLIEFVAYGESVALARQEKRSAESSEETARDALQTLSEKLRPVTVELARRNGVRRLRVAPDGILNLIPFAALSGERGHFLIERFSISYLSAGRDLAVPEPPGRRTALLASAMIIAVSPGAGAKRAFSGSPVAGTFRADRLERLEDAPLEAQDVRRRIPRAQLLGEWEATEQRIKDLHRPALLHIVGHGIVRGTEDCRGAPGSPGCELAGIDPAARVMSLSAIVLEEAYGRGGDSSEDGLLTALELQTLDLRGTEMLVLSQCRMADGVPSSGEGVYGMRRAAAIAGVKTFVAPLWKVADAAQQEFMRQFYKELSAGKGRAEALRQAQLRLLTTPRTASFLHWAPVILSGDPAPLPRELFAR
ncbi:MAG: CHAT domain-containing protein [Acidobacteria bacterium]|nr:CHAT domain-containing protein [Acidobacteriota bacterium]